MNKKDLENLRQKVGWQEDNASVTQHLLDRIENFTSDHNKVLDSGKTLNIKEKF